MKFNIISINDERKAYKDQIRKHAGMEEVRIPSVNAHKVDLPSELKLRGLENRPWSPKIGELGVWLSNFDCWQWAADNEELVVFEDDAIIDNSFSGQLTVLQEDLPDDWDYVALWVPENQEVDYTYNVTFDEKGDPVHQGPALPYKDSLFRYTRRVAHVYQGYGMVSLMYSPRGAAKLIDLVRSTGIYTPVDCFVYQQAHMGNLKGFAPSPLYANVVKYDWSAASHVQQTERAVV